MTDSVFTMNKWTLRFVSNKAEQQFLSAGSKHVSVWYILVISLIATIFVAVLIVSQGLK